MTAPLDTSGRTKLDAILRRRRQARAIRWLVLLLVLGAGTYLWLRFGRELAPEPGSPERVQPAQAEPAAPAPSESREEAVQPAPPPSSPPPPEPLPALDESDDAVREAVLALSSDPRLAAWLGVDDLVERFALAVVNVAEGASPRKPLAVLAPVAPFRARSQHGRLTPHPASYARYDGIASVFAGLDAEAVARFYRRFEPLFDEAHARLGSEAEPLRESLTRAAAELLATPLVQGEPELVFHVNRYLYADPELESLSSAQKLLLRMGPRNVRRIQEKIREIARALGVPDRELPAPSSHRVDAP